MAWVFKSGQKVHVCIYKLFPKRAPISHTDATSNTFKNLSAGIVSQPASNQIRFVRQIFQKPET